MAVVTPVTLTSVVQRKSCRMGHTVMLACASARTGFADDMGDEAGLKMLPMYTLDDTRYNRRLVTRMSVSVKVKGFTRSFSERSLYVATVRQNLIERKWGQVDPPATNQIGSW